MTGQWFSLSNLVSSTNKIDCHDRANIDETNPNSTCVFVKQNLIECDYRSLDVCIQSNLSLCDHKYLANVAKGKEEGMLINSFGGGGNEKLNGT